MAASFTPPKARASSPAAKSRSRNVRTPKAEVNTAQPESAGSGKSSGTVWTAGLQTTCAPSGRSFSASRPALAPGAVTSSLFPKSGAAENQSN